MPKKVTNIVEVLAALDEFGLRPLLNRIEKTETIMADELTTDQALTNIRTVQQRSQLPADTVPLFAWNRTPLRISTVMEDRGRFKTDTFVSGSKADTNQILDTVHAEFDINFIYICENMQQMEQFEIEYVARSGISNIVNQIVNYDDLGQFKYEFFWGELEDKVLQEDGKDIKVIRGSVLIRGFFFIFEDEAKRINCIQFNTYKQTSSLNKEVVFGNVTIQ